VQQNSANWIFVIHGGAGEQKQTQRIDAATRNSNASATLSRVMMCACFQINTAVDEFPQNVQRSIAARSDVQRGLLGLVAQVTDNNVVID
jgi:hypothetical protein